MDKDFSYINELMDSPARLSNAGKNETTTPHHQGGTEKQDDGKHNRSVSWDHAEDEERDGDGPEIPPHLMPPKPKPKISNWKKLTAKNIIEMTPTEDRAETYLQKQLEAKAAASNEEQEELDRVGDALSGIREEHLNEFAAKGSSAKKGPRSVASSTFSKTRNLKGGDKLFGLVSQLTGGYTAEGLKKSSGTIIDYDGDDEDVPEEQDMPTTHTDALVNNAAQIFLRKGKATKKATTTETTTTYEPVDDTKPDKKPSIVAMEEGKMKKNIIRKQADKVKDTMSGDFHDFVDFVKEGKSKIWARVRNALIFLILPSIGAAFLCFYALDNPPCGTAEECQEKGKAIPRYDSNGTLIEIEYFDDPNNQASVSWWFLFIGVRLVITLGVSLLFQAVLVDFCCLTTSMCTRLFGSFITLFIVQSKGLPFLVFTWGLINFAVLQGTNKFSRHWLYWQDWLDIFNEANQAGAVLNHPFYQDLLTAMMIAGVCVAIKRYWLGLYMGKRTYLRWASELGKVMEKAVLIRDVANLSRMKVKKMGIPTDLGDDVLLDTSSVDEQSQASKTKEGWLGSHLTGSTQMRIDDLLGEFEEPEMFQEEEVSVAISDIIRFRQSVAFLNTSMPFSRAFGRADNREVCIANSQLVYERLLKIQDEDMLHFNALARLCMEDGELDEVKLRHLIKLFRPDRDGSLTKLDFVKSVDAVYKEIRLLRAGLANSQRVDRASQKIFHVAFYFILGCICLAILGIDPIALFFAVSGIVVGFSFMIGAAASKVFEGFLLILIRKPYEIGDKINVSNVTTDTPGGGSAGWLVKDMDLFSTTVTYWNGEVATYANGYLAPHRIINMNRSDSAFQTFLVKFPSRTDIGKILLFRKCVEQFVKDRPREWKAFNGFRMTRVEIDQGFVEYKVMMTHRENWQNLGAVLTSSAEVMSFSSELEKKMGVEYQAVPMPIDLSIVGKKAARGHTSGTQSVSSVEAADLMAQMQSDNDLADLEAASEVKGLDSIKKIFSK